MVQAAAVELRKMALKRCVHILNFHRNVRNAVHPRDGASVMSTSNARQYDQTVSPVVMNGALSS